MGVFFILAVLYDIMTFICVTFYYNQTDSSSWFYGKNVLGALAMQLLEMCECDLICKMGLIMFIKYRPIWEQYKDEWTFSLSIYIRSLFSYCEKLECALF